MVGGVTNVLIARSTRAKRLAQEAVDTVAAIQSDLDSQRAKRRELAAELEETQVKLHETQQIHARDAVHIQELEAWITELAAKLARARSASNRDHSPRTS
jgi:septal ring factor EnvC (AmiA/AmiB activator)